MKKNVSTALIRIISMVILCCFFTSFIIHSNDIVSTVKTVNQTTESKHNFLKTTVLTLGLLGGAALLRRRFRLNRLHFHRHHRHEGGMGCLGVLGVIGLVIVGLVLLPLILVGLVVVGVAALFGVRFHRSRRRHRRFD
jgi:hypothetical protein